MPRSSEPIDAMATTEQAERLRRIDALADGFRARARALDDEGAFPEENFAELRAAGLLALTAPGEFGGEDLWWDGRYRRLYELLHHLARIDSVTAQLLQVHSHALGILSRLASPEQARALLPGIVADGRLLASVGSEARPGGQARRHRAHGARGARRRLAPDVLEVLRVAGAGADELLVWTAVPGAGRYQERGVVGARPARRAGGHARRPVGRAGHARDRLVGRADRGLRRAAGAARRRARRVDEQRSADVHARLRREPPRRRRGRAGLHDRLGARAPGARGSEYTRVLLGGMSSELFAAESAMWAAADLWDAGGHDEAELASIRTLHLAKRLALDTDAAGVRRLRRAGDVPRPAPRAPVPRRPHVHAALPRRAVHAPGRPGDARRGVPRQGLRGRLDVPGGSGAAGLRPG